MIVRVAVKKNNKVYVGKKGWRHDKVILSKPKTFFHQDSTQGFVTDKGEFLDREKACHHAFRYGQIKKDGDCLISEELW